MTSPNYDPEPQKQPEPQQQPQEPPPFDPDLSLIAELERGLPPVHVDGKRQEQR